MIVVLAVSLYTSRVILDGLGVEDYGIYNVVAGLVVSFSFITTTLSATSMRYYSLEIGRDNTEGLIRLFNTNIQIFCIVSVAFLLFAETVGLYLMYHILNIPDERFSAAIVLFQLSVISCILQILQTPFSAAIIASERMSFFGYIGIIEALLKLTISVIICNTVFDRLIYYGILLMAMYLIILIIYIIYAKKKIAFCCFKKVRDSKLFKGIFSFSGWSLFESIADILSIQGISVLLNVFYGVIVNAAAGVAAQVTSVVWGFISNFQTAFKPQMIKYYSQGDKDNYERLLFQTSKFSYFLYFIVAAPVFINLPLLFELWLKHVPDYSLDISRVVLINLFVGTLAAPIWVLIQAQGSVQKYQYSVTSIVLLNLPFAFLALELGFSPVFVYITRGIVAGLCHLSRIIFMKKQLNIGIRLYVSKVIVPLSICTMLAAIPPLITYSVTTGFTQLFLSTIVSLLTDILVFYFIGLTKGERQVVSQYVITLKNKIL